MTSSEKAIHEAIVLTRLAAKLVDEAAACVMTARHTEFPEDTGQTQRQINYDLHGIRDSIHRAKSELQRKLHGKF